MAVWTLTGEERRTVAEVLTDILASKTLAHVAAIAPDGEPQSTPIRFVWDGERASISQTEGQQELKNLCREPRVALSMVDPGDPNRNLEIRSHVESEVTDADRAFVRQLSRKDLVRRIACQVVTAIEGSTSQCVVGASDLPALTNGLPPLEADCPCG